MLIKKKNSFAKKKFRIEIIQFCKKKRKKNYFLLYQKKKGKQNLKGIEKHLSVWNFCPGLNFNGFQNID